MKKHFKFFLLFIFLFILFNVNVKASSDQLTGLNVIKKEPVQTISGNVELHKEYIETLDNGIGPKINSHTVNYAVGNIKNGIHVVTHSSSYEHNWTALTTKNAMIDWEKTHPGWICVAGINGDGFDINNTKQPYHFYMEDGNFLRPQGDGIILGFKSNNELVCGNPNVSEMPFIRTYDETHTKIIKEVPITVINRKPSEKGINLYTKDNMYPVDLTGYKVYVCKYDIVRCGYSNIYSFVKGSVEDVIDGCNDMTPPLRYFYLASKNNDLIESCKVGDYIKCEYKVSGEFQNVLNMCGCPNELFNGDSINFKGSTVDFEFITHPRTCIGFKENGDVCLLTIDGRGSKDKYLEGASLYEAGQIFKNLGYDKAYNLDGGGSTTLVAKKNNGEFTVLNTPSDGRERACGNHILFVMKDPGFNVNTNDVTYKDLNMKFKFSNDANRDKAENIIVSCNGKDYKYNGNDIKISNLEENHLYNYSITYDIYDDILKQKVTNTLQKQFKTKAFKLYEVPFENIINGNVLTLIDKKLPNVYDLKVEIGDNTLDFTTQPQQLIENLEYNKEYIVKYTYLYKNTDNMEKEITEEIKIHTKSHTIPYGFFIEEVNHNHNTIDLYIEFKDYEGFASDLYVLLNDDYLVEINSYKPGYNKINISLDDLDFVSKNQTFKVILEYILPNEKSYTLESNSLSFMADSSLQPKNNYIPIIIIASSCSIVGIALAFLIVMKKRKTKI